MSCSALQTWTNTDAEEAAMNHDHFHLWKEMIQQIEMPSLQDKKVLDYGCNQGGFLNLLYAEKPFAEGYGVDIASFSVAHANKHKNPHAPLTYGSVESLAAKENYFDVAFSHEVIYLLDDLDAHAKVMAKTLKEGGIYYAAIGCHTDNPLWDEWVKVISAYSNLEVNNYSLNDYADAFFDNGFSVSARPYQIQGFIPIKRKSSYFPKISDSLHYHSFVKTLFRFEKKGA
jgi:SAM-dependent methyltransferase